MYTIAFLWNCVSCDVTLHDFKRLQVYCVNIDVATLVSEGTALMCHARCTTSCHQHIILKVLSFETLTQRRFGLTRDTKAILVLFHTSQAVKRGRLLSLDQLH